MAASTASQNRNEKKKFSRVGKSPNSCHLTDYRNYVIFVSLRKCTEYKFNLLTSHFLASNLFGYHWVIYYY